VALKQLEMKKPPARALRLPGALLLWRRSGRRRRGIAQLVDWDEPVQTLVGRPVREHSPALPLNVDEDRRSILLPLRGDSHGQNTPITEGTGFLDLLGDRQLLNATSRVAFAALPRQPLPECFRHVLLHA